MADDIAAAPRLPAGAVSHADARSPDAWRRFTPDGVDACVTSPPYLNGVSYAEAPRLEALFLRRADSWASLNALASNWLVASSPQQATQGRAAAAKERLAALPLTRGVVDLLDRRLAAERARRPRGKAYDALLWCYFADMAEVFSNLIRALSPGARAAMVIGDSAPYGVRVDTPALLGGLAEELGGRVHSDVYVRARGGKWPGVGARHNRRLEERLIVVARPAYEAQTQLPGFDDVR